MVDRNETSLESWVVAAGRPDAPGEPLNHPIVTATNFVLGGDREYSRNDGSATVAALEELIGGLEGGSAITFGSGMAAAAAVFDTLATGATIVIPDDCYQGVAALAADGEARGRWTVQRLAPQATPDWLEAVGSADLVWVESPSNPLLVVADVPAICAAPRGDATIVAVDNTFATPFNQRPLAVGADIVMHSATKFIGGHSDLLLGALVVADDELERSLRRSQLLTGAMPGSLEAFLALRGARTMAVRLRQGQSSAHTLAQRLADHPRVDVVRYPGLPDDPQHAIASRVLDGFGAMVSFDVSGSVADADAVLARLGLITNATSLGGVESTIERRSRLEGQQHLPPTLLRLSVGCEDPEDLWADLDQALTG